MIPGITAKQGYREQELSGNGPTLEVNYPGDADNNPGTILGKEPVTSSGITPGHGFLPFPTAVSLWNLLRHHRTVWDEKHLKDNLIPAPEGLENPLG